MENKCTKDHDHSTHDHQAPAPTFISLTVKDNDQEEGQKCYSCLKPVFIGDVLFNTDSVYFVYDANFKKNHNLELGESSFIETHGQCSYCKSKILFSENIPFSYGLQSEKNLTYDVNPKIVPVLERKLSELFSFYRTIWALSKTSHGPSIHQAFSKFPFYYLPHLINEEVPKLKIYGYKNFVSDLSQQLKNLYSNQIKKYMDKNMEKISDVPGSSYYDSRNVNFNNIDHERYDYKTFMFLDIDGTSSCKTLHAKTESSPKLSEYLFRVCKQLESRKLVKTVLCTGRPIEWAFLHSINYFKDPLVIASVGSSCVYLRKSNDYSKSLTHIQVQGFRSKFDNLIQILRCKYHLDPVIFLNQTMSSPLLLIDPHSINQKYLEQIIETELDLKQDQRKEGKFHVHFDGSWITVSTTTKAQAALKLIDSLGRSSKDFFNVGNHQNDISLTEICSSYAVKNATQEYKKAVDHVCNENQAKGVLEAMEHFLVQNDHLSKDEFDQIKEQVRKGMNSQLEDY